jgi:hypothetical protein
MSAITNIGLIFAGAGGLILAAHGASSETARPSDQPRVVRPTSMNAGAGLQLASHGIGELTTDDGIAISVLHVRAVITNTTPDLPWALDASNARIDLASGPIAAAFVSSDAATLPIAILHPRERRTIDLFFPLTPDLADQGGPPGFALTWAVYTPARNVRTAWFDCAAAVAPSGPPDAAWGEHWWFDPAYTWPAYRHRAGPVTHRPPRYVVMTRAPRWDEMPVDADDVEGILRECDQW